MPLYIPVCRRCQHYIIAGSCMAYPFGIPDEVWQEQDNHIQARVDDNGYQFAPMDDEGAGDYTGD